MFEIKILKDFKIFKENSLNWDPLNAINNDALAFSSKALNAHLGIQKHQRFVDIWISNGKRKFFQRLIVTGHDTIFVSEATYLNLNQSHHANFSLYEEGIRPFVQDSVFNFFPNVDVCKVLHLTPLSNYDIQKYPKLLENIDLKAFIKHPFVIQNQLSFSLTIQSKELPKKPFIISF